MQRYINFDGTLKGDPLPANNGSESKTSLEELLIPARSGDERSRGQRLRDIAKLVDTTLFRAYMLARPSMAGPLFRLPNFCDADVVSEKLLESKRYNDLIDFFFGKQLHRKALDLLRDLAKNKSDDDCPEHLRGPERTVVYLQSLPPSMIDLILEYAEWPVQENPELGMQIFVADTENAETLPREKVLEFLRGIDPQLSSKYLEHIIQELDDDNPVHHQRLINEYLQRLKSSEGENEQKKADLKEALLQFLRTSKHYDSYTVLRTLAEDGMIMRLLGSRQADNARPRSV